MRKVIALLILAMSVWGLGQGAAALAAQQNQAASAALDAINQLQAAPAQQAGRGRAFRPFDHTLFCTVQKSVRRKLEKTPLLIMGVIFNGKSAGLLTPASIFTAHILTVPTTALRRFYLGKFLLRR